MNATHSAFLAAGFLRQAVSALAWRAETGVTGTRVLSGQSAAFSGLAAQPGIDLHAAARLYFDSINQRVGIHGPKMEIVTGDDKYEPALTVENTRRAGPELSREKFIEALETITLKNYDIGFPVEFSPTRHTGSVFVDRTVITKNEKFLN